MTAIGHACLYLTADIALFVPNGFSFS